MSKRVLMMSHGPTGVTGFSKQLYLQSRALTELDDFEVFVVHRDYRGEPIVFNKGSNIKMQSGRLLDNFTMLPIGQDQWGQDVIPWYINRYNIDYVHTLGDIWCYQYLREVKNTTGWKWLAHYVFDTENIVGFWNDCVRAANISVVPAKFAQDMLVKAGHKNSIYIPHGVDMNTYKPATHEEKTGFRKEFGIPEDMFVVGMVAHNQYRKMVHRLIEAFHLFWMKNPKSLLVMHCLPKDSTGWDLPQLLRDRHLLGNVIFTDKSAKGVSDIHVPESEMRKLYCTMDAHALSTGGEGFGIPIVEAMACGIPNIMTGYTTANEFLTEETDGPNGKKIRLNDRGISVPYVDVELHHTGGIWAKCDIPKMAEALQYLKDNPSEGKQMGMKARKFAVNNYDERLVSNVWKETYQNFDSIANKNDDSREQMAKLHLMRVG